MTTLNHNIVFETSASIFCRKLAKMAIKILTTGKQIKHLHTYFFKMNVIGYMYVPHRGFFKKRAQHTRQFQRQYICFNFNSHNAYKHNGLQLNGIFQDNDNSITHVQVPADYLCRYIHTYFWKRIHLHMYVDSVAWEN
jgi:hypothetical protein